MKKGKNLQEMSLGRLVDRLITLKGEFISKIREKVDSKMKKMICDEYGSIGIYHKKITEAYAREVEEIVSELNRREGIYLR